MLDTYHFSTPDFLIVMAFLVAMGARIVIGIIVPIEKAERERDYNEMLLEKLRQLEREEDGD